MGRVDGQVDLEPLLYTARHRPEWTFVLMGPVTRPGAEQLQGQENIVLTGPVNPLDVGRPVGPGGLPCQLPPPPGEGGVLAKGAFAPDVQRRIFMKKVAVIMGSDSDWPVVKGACAQLEAFGIPYEAHILSAHRRPESGRPARRRSWRR